MLSACTSCRELIYINMCDTPIIVSMTTWPIRCQNAVEAMRSIVFQQHTVPVKYMLALSLEEKDGIPDSVLNAMRDMGVEVIWDNGNVKSHKKLMPAIERYPDSPIIVVDDDMLQKDGWLQAFIDDHIAHPYDIIYGQSGSVVEIHADRIFEGIAQRGNYTTPGAVTFNVKPANGSAGTLYPAGTITDPRFFDRSLYMRLSPTSDETWQWAFAVMAGRTFRCLSSHNYPDVGSADQRCALFKQNIFQYTKIHNDIACVMPEYKVKLQELINKKKHDQ